MRTSFHHIFFFIFFPLFVIFNFSQSQQPTCQVSSCDRPGPKVRFPFRIRSKQDRRCGYPGLDLYCNERNKTILDIPNAGEFIVNRIDYKNEYLFINDQNPNSCLGKRVLNFSTSGSPFTVPFPKKMVFLNCSESGNWWSPNKNAFPVFCLVTGEYSVLAADPGFPPPPTCRFMAAVEVPVQEGSDKEGMGWWDLYRDFQLTWRVPGCGSCERKGGTCGYLNYTRQETGCFNLPRALSRKLKYGLIIGVGIPGLACLTAAAWYMMGRIRTFDEHESRLNPENMNIAMITRPAITVSGLDGATIESYPKIVVGESRRLPNPSNKTCSICLGEYQPEETLRTIPKCNHYFHANCVDEWLRLNPTCPLCRESPTDSSAVAPNMPASSSLLS